MRLYDQIAALIVLAAGFSYLNHRLLRLPATIGLMALTLLTSVAVVAAGEFIPEVEHRARALVAQLDLNQALLHGMLGFLLFAGALHIDLDDLARHRWPIAVLASLGVVASTVLVGGLMWGVLALLGTPMRPIDCLVFGALISPTDPIAVLGLLKRFGAPRELEVQIAGESLFNDGVGVVVFAGLLEVATGEHGLDLGHLASLFVRESIGGAAFGLAAGYLVYRLLRSLNDYKVEVLLSLALVAGGYALADALHLSGPIAMVVAGLLIGNPGRAPAMSSTTRERLDEFWELVDEVLNAVLFVLIGLEVLVLTFTARVLAAGLLTIPAVLAARWVSVALPVRLLRRWAPFAPATVRVLTWGGLRGGLSVAMALSLPAGLGGDRGSSREPILAITYLVVVFSILVQGLTIGPLTRRWLAETPCLPAGSTPEDGRRRPLRDGDRDDSPQPGK